MVAKTAESLSRSEVVGSVLACLRLLASQCDGAVEDDGVGFNGADSEFGKSLAAREQLSDRQALSGARLLQKYRKQIEKFGNDLILPSIEDVEAIVYAEDSVAAKIKAFAAEQGQMQDSKLKPVKRAAVTTAEPAVAPVDVLELKPWLTSRHRVGLSEQQQEAFDAVHEWFFGESPESFVLKGFGGTGKSHTAQRIIHSIQETVQTCRPAAVQHRLGYVTNWDSGSRQVIRRPLTDRVKVGLCAPTHKAVEVLSGFAEAAGLTDVQVGTLHSFLHVAPGEFEADGKQKLTEIFSKSDHYSSFGLMVIDEASMCSPELLAFIPPGIPTLFMGDPAQLPPVTAAEDSQVEPQESPVFALEPRYQLTHVMRYDGAILAMATDIRNNLDSPHCPAIPRNANNLIGLSEVAWEAELLACFKESDFGNNPNSIRALAYRNKRVAELNQKIRATLYPDATERYSIGEVVTANEPVFVWSKQWQREEIRMQSCQEGRILSVEPGQATLHSELLQYSVTVEILEIVLESKGEFISVKVLRQGADHELNQGKDGIAQYLKQWRTAILELGKGGEKGEQKGMRGRHWAAYYWALKDLNLVLKGKNLMDRLQYAYSLTIHKSQGSTIQTVFADFRDINAARINRTKNQLRYVALTRAAEAAYILK
jgi:hypothetical protein